MASNFKVFKKFYITPEAFMNNSELFNFYTGLLNWTIFNTVMTLASPSLPKMPNSKLSTFEMLALFFMRVKLYLYEEDIGYRFEVHRTTVSRCFFKVQMFCMPNCRI